MSNGFPSGEGQNVGFYAAGRKFETWKDWSFGAATYWLPASDADPDPNTHPTLGTPIEEGTVYYNTQSRELKIFDGTDFNGFLEFDYDTPGLWRFGQMPQVMVPTVGFQPIIPPGGSPTQILSKSTTNDYQVQWVDAPSGTFDPSFDYVITGSWSFPNGLSINGSAITLTGNQINNAALQSAANTFTAVNTFSAGMQLANANPLRFFTADGLSTPAVLNLDNNNRLQVGNDAVSVDHRADASGHVFYHDAATVAQTRSRADGSLAIADSAGTFDAVAAVHKSQTFAAEQIFNSGIRMGSNTPLHWRNAADSANIVGLTVDGTDFVQLGESSAPRTNVNFADLSQFFRSNLEVGRFTDRGLGSLLISDAAGTLGAVAAVHKAQTFTALNTFAAQVTVQNNIALASELAGGGQLRMIRYNTADELEVGHNSSVLDRARYIVNPSGGSHLFQLGTTVTAQVLDAAQGGLLVRDRVGSLKKTGYRNPAVRQLGSNTTLTQDYESQVIIPTVSNQVWTLPALEENTVFRIMVPTGVTSIRVSPATGITIRALLGNDEIVKVGSGQIGVAPSSVAEFFYRSATEVYMFGNGITDFAV
ncbi:MAG: hypothetical protein QNI96_05300 [Woeseiaceae bacterium]|nr:hypothetical protein [Woeseiaceae bacterium]